MSYVFESKLRQFECLYHVKRHGTTLRKAVPQIQDAITRAGTPPRGVKVFLRGQVPALQQTINGLQIGLLLAFLLIFLLLAANFRRFAWPLPSS